MSDPVRLHDEGWQHTADRSSLYKDPTTPQRQAKLRRGLAELGANLNVLDYGCGRGEFTQFIASLGHRAVGLDISEKAVEYNRQDFPDIPFVLSSPGSPAPFADGSFDAIWSSEVIEHVYDVHWIFGDFSRLLRPGGRLIVTTPYHGAIKNILVVLFGFERHFNVEWQHIRFWTKKSLTRVALAHSLRPVWWSSVGRLPPLAKSFFSVFEK
jgi:SAM-dependent methyltransferase